VLFDCIPKINIYDTLTFGLQVANKNPVQKEAKNSKSSSRSREGKQAAVFIQVTLNSYSGDRIQAKFAAIIAISGFLPFDTFTG
jgi:hypothetical protein